MCHPFHRPLIMSCNNIRRMFERVTQSRFAGRSVIAAGIACTLLAYGSVLAQAPSSANANAIGWYTVLIRGYYTGDGSAQVNGGSVVVTVKVHDDSGNTGVLSGTFPMVGDHFSGPGSVMGVSITVQGRVDAADPPTSGIANADADAIVTDARLGATVVDTRGHTGRIAGTKLKSGPSTQPASGS
jgi:hypothetical protein